MQTLTSFIYSRRNYLNFNMEGVRGGSGGTSGASGYKLVVGRGGVVGKSAITIQFIQVD